MHFRDKMVVAREIACENGHAKARLTDAKTDAKFAARALIASLASFRLQMRSLT
jgi:hypothetical protein